MAYQQDLHFRQWFKVVEKMGYDWSKDLEHVAFGMVSYEGRALSTREGYVVYLDELLTRWEDMGYTFASLEGPA